MFQNQILHTCISSVFKYIIMLALCPLINQRVVLERSINIRGYFFYGFSRFAYKWHVIHPKLIWFHKSWLRIAINNFYIFSVYYVFFHQDTFYATFFYQRESNLCVKTFPAYFLQIAKSLQRLAFMSFLSFPSVIVQFISFTFDARIKKTNGLRQPKHINQLTRSFKWQ